MNFSYDDAFCRRVQKISVFFKRLRCLFFKMFEKLKAIPTHMDYEGQKKAEKIYQAIVIVVAAIGFAVGYLNQQFSHTVYILIAGFLLSSLLTLPPWPFYRTKALPWQKPVPEDGVETTPGSKKQKKK